ncbi:hypothetical protein ACIPY5_00235 [Microbacterium sp. NPDC089698]|uniref:hypothetical protein n=1 Tax=Microbacterium sp. NPDC089698 TaxID=3364200 RepID=UPI0037F83EAF
MSEIETLDEVVGRPWLERAGARLASTFRGHGGFVLVTLGALASAFAAIPGVLWPLIVGAVLVIVGIVVQVRLSPSYAEMIDERRKDRAKARESALALQGALWSILRRIATHCDLKQTHQRISIYCHVDGKFVMLARFSENAHLQEPGRGIYPGRRGVIGEAWERGKSIRRDWPADRDEWNAFQVREYGFRPEEAAALAMQACSMVALRLTHDAVSVGVLVMESEQRRGVGDRHRKAAADSLLLASLCEIMLSAQPHFPAVSEFLATADND